MEVLRRRIFSNNVNNVEGDYENEYLTFTAINSGTFKFTGTTVNGNTNSLSYSIDDGVTWKALASGSNSPTIQAGGKILWKGENLGILKTGANLGIGTFSASGNFEASGNIMSLYYGDDFYGIYNLPDKYIFATLFKNNSYIKNAENLSLPATTLVDFCYAMMFQGCTGLTTAPTSLPATTLARNCYGSIFRNCTSLTTTPLLPATTLAIQCYAGMFFNCKSLTTAPALPATTLAQQCYQIMFYGCTGITTAPSLPATTLDQHCYTMMFQGCTGLTAAPVLPATTLAQNCYSAMFNGCTNLNYIKAMFITTPSDTYTSNWVLGVAASGTFVKNSAARWNVTGINGIPSGWTVQTASS